VRLGLAVGPQERAFRANGGAFSVDEGDPLDVLCRKFAPVEAALRPLAGA
jgi:hypothetical protein